jgi:non-homologous end joining protein Ku
MAPRAYWKGYLKLSLVSCPIALFPVTSEREKFSAAQALARPAARQSRRINRSEA